MEEIILKFPHLSEEIFNCLDNESMINCKEVSKIWCDYISDQKFYHIRIIPLNVGKVHEVGKGPSRQAIDQVANLSPNGKSNQVAKLFKNQEDLLNEFNQLEF